MEELLSIFGALSDATRLRILKLLEKGEMCVCNIVKALNMSQPKVSFHLNVLKSTGLIKDRKQGKWIHYSIDDSDMFRRFLILSVLERTEDETTQSALQLTSARINEKKQKEDIDLAHIS